MNKGYIYLLSNESFPHLVKIGKTTNNPNIRAKQLFETGVPTPFVVEEFWEVPIRVLDVFETGVHKYLDSYRFSKNREFFELEIKLAKKKVSEYLNSSGDMKRVESLVKAKKDIQERIDKQNKVYKNKIFKLKELIHIAEPKIISYLERTVSAVEMVTKLGINRYNEQKYKPHSCNWYTRVHFSKERYGSPNNYDFSFTVGISITYKEKGWFLPSCVSDEDDSYAILSFYGLERDQDASSERISFSSDNSLNYHELSSSKMQEYLLRKGVISLRLSDFLRKAGLEDMAKIFEEYYQFKNLDKRLKTYITHLANYKTLLKRIEIQRNPELIIEAIDLKKLIESIKINATSKEQIFFELQEFIEGIKPLEDSIGLY